MAVRGAGRRPAGAARSRPRAWSLGDRRPSAWWGASPDANERPRGPHDWATAASVEAKRSRGRGARHVGQATKLQLRRAARSRRLAWCGPGRTALVREPTSPAERARAACGPGSAGARWGRSPRPRARSGRATGFGTRSSGARGRRPDRREPPKPVARPRSGRP